MRELTHRADWESKASVIIIKILYTPTLRKTKLFSESGGLVLLRITARLKQAFVRSFRVL